MLNSLIIGKKSLFLFVPLPVKLGITACKERGVKQHPARFPAKLPQFFIRFLTQPGDVVLDIFAGSNTTGFVCEQEDRYWLAFEKNREYLAASALRFKECSKEELETIYQRIVHGEEQVLKSNTKFHW